MLIGGRGCVPGVFGSASNPVREPEVYTWTDAETRTTCRVERVGDLFFIQWNPGWGFDDRGLDTFTEDEARERMKALELNGPVGRTMAFVLLTDRLEEL